MEKIAEFINNAKKSIDNITKCEDELNETFKAYMNYLGIDKELQEKCWISYGNEIEVILHNTDYSFTTDHLKCEIMFVDELFSMSKEDFIEVFTTNEIEK